MDTSRDENFCLHIFNDFDGSNATGAVGAPMLHSGLNRHKCSNSFSESGVNKPWDGQPQQQPTPTSIDNDPNSMNDFEDYEEDTSTSQTKRSKMGHSEAQRLREANRIAAKKCRDKKRAQQQALEQEVQLLQHRNAMLKREMQWKIQEIIHLRTLVEEHKGCYHMKQQEYFGQQARNAAVYQQSNTSQVQTWYPQHGFPSVQQMNTMTSSPSDTMEGDDINSFEFQ